jgi:hypothetical protein
MMLGIAIFVTAMGVGAILLIMLAIIFRLGRIHDTLQRIADASRPGTRRRAP